MRRPSFNGKILAIHDKFFDYMRLWAGEYAEGLKLAAGILSSTSGEEDAAVLNQGTGGATDGDAGGANTAANIEVIGKNSPVTVYESGAGGKEGYPLVSSGKKPFDRAIALTKNAPTDKAYVPAKFHKLFDSTVSYNEQKTFWPGYVFDHPSETTKKSDHDGAFIVILGFLRA